MALGLPVVTTTIGAENISATDKKDWYIEDNDDEFAEIICELLNDNKKAYEVGQNGNKYVTNNFTWDIAEINFKKILK